MSDLKEIAAEVRDQLAYLIVYAPDFPSEDQTTADQECDGLLGLLQAIDARTSNAIKKLWLGLVIEDVRQARHALVQGDAAAANDLFHSAEQHFDAYLSGKVPGATYIVGPDGAAKKA